MWGHTDQMASIAVYHRASQELQTIGASISTYRGVGGKSDLNDRGLVLLPHRSPVPGDAELKVQYSLMSFLSIRADGYLHLLGIPR